EKKKPEPRADTTQTDTMKLASQGGKTPTTREPKPEEIEKHAGLVPGEPDAFPHRPKMPGRDRVRERVDEATGTTQFVPESIGEQPEPETAKAEPKSGVPKPDTTVTPPRTPSPELKAETTIARRSADTTRRIVAYFDTDSAAIRGEADSLEALVAFLKAHTDVQIELVGHCDPRGTDEYNLALGLRRAQAVRKYLVDAGIAETRISVRSRGKQDLRSTRPEEYWLDRRVESRTR
ncbi:MAG: OmpA family protein, partial [candidate division WOR-3 bacterium]